MHTMNNRLMDQIKPGIAELLSKICKSVFALLLVFSLPYISAPLLGADTPSATKSTPKPSVRKWKGKSYKTFTDASTITATLNPSEVAPGGKTKLTFTITPKDKNWYYYEFSPTGENRGKSELGLPILLHLPKQKQITFEQPVANQKATESLDEKGMNYFSYEGTTAFVYDITVSPDAEEGELSLEGMSRVQLCEKGGVCARPDGIAYRVPLKITKSPKAGALQEAEFASIPATEVLRAVRAANPPKEQTPETSSSQTTAPPTSLNSSNAASPKEDDTKNSNVTFQDLPKFEPVSANIDSIYLAIGFGLIGGFILNFMPCVLPVIGLKVLSFVQQAGRQRGQIFMLNLFYTLGIIAVFLVLAALAIIFKKSWGAQNNSVIFNVTMISLVFAMALSFLGIWEIPIPGFASGGSLSEAATHEGYGGAFAKGIVTTLLATPCSGPFLGAVFAFTAKDGTSGASVLAVFFSIGLGMAFPYLLIGVFPKLVRFLPKPGHWMDTFKHLMGFMLLGTVLFLFWSLDRKYFMAMLTFLFALWFAFWWIGQVPIYEAVSKRLKAWAIGGAVAALIGAFSFTNLVEEKSTNELKWQDYSHSNLLAAINAKKAVLVDFTAPWCATCQVNLSLVLNSNEVKEVVDELGITALKVEHTFDEIKGAEGTELLENAFNRKSIPVLAIFPADDPTRPIILDDLLKKGEVIEVLKKAGGLKSETPPVAVSAKQEKNDYIQASLVKESK